MIRLSPSFLGTSFLALVLAAQPAAAIDVPYEKDILRLSEILGSLHFLRNLCGEKGTAWRDEMEKLMAAEKPDEARKARIVASFNHGFRTFEITYSTCTPAAIESINRYMAEGEKLTRDVYGRYGN